MSKNVEKQIDLNKASSQDIERVQAIGKEQARKILGSFQFRCYKCSNCRR